MNRSASLSALLLAMVAAAGAQSSPPGSHAPTGVNRGQASSPATEARAEAYYHFQLARTYQDRAEATGHTDDLNRALEEYRRAIHAAPQSAYIPEQMAELLFRAGQTGDAIRLVQSVIREHPDSAEAHRLLGQIYTHQLGDSSNASRQNDLLQLALREYEQLVTLDPKDSDVHMTLGRLYRAAGKNDAAEREFKAALALDSGSEDAAASLIYLYAEEKDFAGARHVIDSVPEQARSAKVYAAYGFAFEEQKDYAQAVTAYSEAVDMEPENVDYHRGLAQTLFYSGQLQKALAQYQWIARNDTQDGQALLRMSQIYRQMGQFPVAERNLDRAAQLLPESPEIPYYRALLYEAEGKAQQAAAALRDLLQRTARADGNYSEAEQSNRGVFLEKLGTLERNSGNYAGALGAFQQMTALGGDNASRGYVEIADIYRNQHDLARALATTREGLAKHPKDRGLEATQALLLADTGHVDEGVTEIQALLKGTPADRELYLIIGQINQRARRWAQAETAARQAERLATNNAERASAAFLMGGIYERQKRFDDAEAVFKRALQLDPHNAMVLNYLGYMLADRGVRLQEALGYVKEAVQSESQNGSYLDSLGWVYFKLNRFDDASANLRRAAELERDDPTILDHLAELYAHTGQLRDAELNWQRALSIWEANGPGDADPMDIAKVRKKLEDLRVRLARTGQRQ